MMSAQQCAADTKHKLKSSAHPNRTVESPGNHIVAMVDQRLRPDFTVLLALINWH